MNTLISPSEPLGSSSRYARCIELSQRIRWDIDRDVLRGRRLDLSRDFLPEGLARTAGLAFLASDERRLLTQVQGRTYANMFALVERFIGAKMLQLASNHALGDQVATEALVRFTEEELKHQALFRRVEALAADCMIDGYRFVADPDEVARSVLGASAWAVLALTCHIELFTQAHYRESLESERALSPLFKDVFLYHWREESQHAILDELEWRREDAALGQSERDRGVDDFIMLVKSVDGILRAQAAADAEYFQIACSRVFPATQRTRLAESLLAAYRWQYILSGASEARFRKILGSLATAHQLRRIENALAPLAD